MKTVFVAFLLVLACLFLSNLSCQQVEEAAPPAEEAEEAAPPATE